MYMPLPASLLIAMPTSVSHNGAGALECAFTVQQEATPFVIGIHSTCVLSYMYMYCVLMVCVHLQSMIRDEQFCVPRLMVTHLQMNSLMFADSEHHSSYAHVPHPSPRV